MGARKSRTPLVMAAALSLLTSSAGLASDAGTAFAVIDVRPTESGVQIAAHAFSLAPLEVEAEMVIERSGPSGTVSTRQSRPLSLRPGASEQIAQTGLSFASGDAIAITVLLTKEGVVLAQSKVTAGR